LIICKTEADQESILRIVGPMKENIRKCALGILKVELDFYLNCMWQTCSSHDLQLYVCVCVIYT